MNIFWGMKILWIFFWGHQKIGLYWSFICILGSSLKVKVQNGGYFFGLQNFKYFFLCLKFLIFLVER